MSSSEMATSAQQNPAYHAGIARVSKALAFFTFILIVAGALVTGNKAALSDPTWPTFVGKPIPTADTFVGGTRFEDAHRVIAAIVSLLTIWLVILIQIRDSRPVMRKLAWGSLILLLAQALVGGLIIHWLRPFWVSMLHGCLGQGFLMLAVAMAVLTAKSWVAPTQLLEGQDNGSYLSTMKWAIGLVYLQLILGTSIRHIETGFMWHLGAHVAIAVVILMVTLWVALRTRYEYRSSLELNRWGTVLIVMIMLQVMLGVFSIFANRARLEPQMPSQPDIWVSTAHVGVGALVLATLVAMMITAHRLLSVPARRMVPKEAFAVSQGQ